MLPLRRAFFLLSLLIPAVPSAWGQAPAIAPGGVVNAADYSREIAPGSLFSVFAAPGSTFASGTAVASIPLPAQVGGVSVDIVDGGRTLSAPIWFVSKEGQINAQMPFGITGATVQVRVRTAGGTSGPETATILPRAPRFFTKDATGKGEAILLHSDYKLVTQDYPAAPGEAVVAYLNGLGAVSPSLEDGHAGASAAPLNTADPVQVSVGGGAAQASLFAGMAPGFLVYQVNFRIPDGVADGFQPIAVTAGQAQSASGVSIWVGAQPRTVEAQVPYLNCTATEHYKDPALVFSVTCPATPVSNAGANGRVPLVWNAAGTEFSANGRIPGAAPTDYCDVVIAGQLDPAAHTLATARFTQKCHTEDAAKGLVRDTNQDYTITNLPLAADPLGYTQLYRVAGTDARGRITQFAFDTTDKRTDGSLYMTWAQPAAPAPAAADVVQVGFVQ